MRINALKRILILALTFLAAGRPGLTHSPADIPGAGRPESVPSVLTVLSSESTSSKKISREKKHALEYLSRPDIFEKFGKISDEIWSFAELGLEEFKSSDLLVKTLEEAGFSVETGLAGMPTCFVATYGTGKPVIGILGEYDALPMISQKARVPSQAPLVEGAPGHGCGHNLMGTAAAAAAIAVKKAIEKYNLSGTVKMFGSPAEEMVISRPHMIRAGLFEGVDAVIDNHASSGFGTAYGRGGSALVSAIFRFSGRTAHSAGSPWSGRSALDAVELMNVATNYLHEHLHFSHRLHYIILEGGEAPNVVPDRASVWYYVRNNDERLNDMFDRVVNCAKGAALATGTQLDTIQYIAAVHQRHWNKHLAELCQENIELVGMPDWTEQEHTFAKELQKNLEKDETGMPAEVDSLKPPGKTFVGGGSSDVGDVTLIAPTATIRFPGMAKDCIGHHWSVVACNWGSTAWKGLNAGAKAMAATAVDLMTKPALLKDIKKEFEEYSEKNPYEPFLPEFATPPLGINRELMDKYRSLMEKTHPGS